MNKYNIECDTGYPHEDCGRWRSYELVASGNTKEELLADAHIFEVDQDGGSLGDYPLEDTGGKLYELGLALIDQGIAEHNKEASDAISWNGDY